MSSSRDSVRPPDRAESGHHDGVVTYERRASFAGVRVCASVEHPVGCDHSERDRVRSMAVMLETGGGTVAIPLDLGRLSESELSAVRDEVLNSRNTVFRGDW